VERWRDTSSAARRVTQPSLPPSLPAPIGYRLVDPDDRFVYFRNVIEVLVSKVSTLSLSFSLSLPPLASSLPLLPLNLPPSHPPSRRWNASRPSSISSSTRTGKSASTSQRQNQSESTTGLVSACPSLFPRFFPSCPFWSTSLPRIVFIPCAHTCFLPPSLRQACSSP